MSIAFSNSISNNGIVEQTRDFTRTDADMWSTQKIVNSCNNYLDTITGYAIGADRRFQWDDTNHTKLPIGTTNLIANQSDYSFLVDEQGNNIINLNRIDILDSNGIYRQLAPIDESEITGIALDEFMKTAGFPLYYDKIADNVIRLYPKPVSSVTNGLKFYFQRTPSYFAETDTTKSAGVSPLLHRGFVINSAYDCAFTLGLDCLQALSVERQLEDKKMQDYFSIRETDEPSVIIPKWRSSR